MFFNRLVAMVSISTTVPCWKVGLEPISLMSVAWVFLLRVNYLSAPAYFFANNESLFCYRSLMQETMAATSFYILSSFVETNVGSCHACHWETADWSMVCYCTAWQPQSTLPLSLSPSLFPHWRTQWKKNVWQIKLKRTHCIWREIFFSCPFLS